MDTFSLICQIIALHWYLHLRWSCLTLWNHFENLTSSAATFPQRLRLCRIHIDRGSTKASPRAVWLLWIIMRLSLMERNVTHLPHVSYIVTFVCTLHKFVIHCHHYHNCHIDVTLCHTVSHIDVWYTIIIIIVQSLHNIDWHLQQCGAQDDTCDRYRWRSFPRDCTTDHLSPRR